MDKIVWTALEYEEKERSSDWFWALGVIIFATSTAAIIYGNYFFATLLILSGAMLAYLAVRKPELVTYELNEKGFQVGHTLYPYERIKAFWVQKQTYEPAKGEHPELNLKPMLFIKSERVFMPILTIPIENARAEEIRSFLAEKNVVEEEMRETFTEKIMEALGF